MMDNFQNNKTSNETPFLTIGYATHNRKELISKRLTNLIGIDIPNNIEIIVVDNASTDGSYDAIKELSSNTNIKTFRNENNLGFSGNFVEVMKKAKGDYVIWCSDEDEINFNGVQDLFTWIMREKPDSVCLNHYRKEESDKLLHLRKNRTRPLKPNDIWGTSHLPGILWNRIKTLENLIDWDTLKLEYPQLSRYYPNILLLLRMMPAQRSFFYNGYITYQMDFAKSQHITVDGSNYCHLISRWQQHKEIISFIEQCKSLTEDKIQLRYLSRIDRFLNRNLYDYVSEAIRQESPYFYNYFSRSSTPVYVIRRWYRLIKLVIKSLFDNPLLAIKKIKKRLINRYLNKKL